MSEKKRVRRAPETELKTSAFYEPKDVQNIDYKENIGDPGQFPFTRGIHPEMYQKQLWTMRQYAGFASAEESNRRYRYLLSQGTTGLSVAYDLPTQIGLDSDHPLALGEVGRVGVAIDSVEDMGTLFEGLPLDRLSTSMTINATAPILLALYLVVARRQKVPWASLRGTVQNDILKEYVARGTYIYPAGPSLRLAIDTIRFCGEQVPKWNPISISGYHIREAGSTAAQEIAFTLANAETYVQAAIDSGLELSAFAARLSFFFNAHSDFFEEVAKFRAARRLWARTMRDRFGAKESRICQLRFHAQTAGSTLTAQQPDNNAVRVALQALAAVLGGAQSLHTNSKDEALSLPTRESARLALRTQQIIAYESGVTEVADPMGGSWYLESLTNRLEEEAAGYCDQIREQGGILAALENGYIAREIQRSAFEHQRAVESGDAVVVGLNRFETGAESVLQTLRIDPKVEALQVDRLRNFRKRRDQQAVEKALDRLRRAARSEGPLMERIVAAVEAGATVGEVSDAMREVFGEHHETVVI